MAHTWEMAHKGMASKNFFAWRIFSKKILDAKSWCPTSQSPSTLGLSSLSYLLEFELDLNLQEDEANLERRCKIKRRLLFLHQLENFHCQKKFPIQLREERKLASIPCFFVYSLLPHAHLEKKKEK